MRKIYSEQEIITDLVSIGIKKGDTVLVRASLNKLGRTTSRERDFFAKCILKVIGDEGTLVALSFTNTSFLGIGRNKNSITFHRDAISNAGAFSNSIIKMENAIRSSHPTNSFIAVGKHAKFITDQHDCKSMSYTPMKALIKLNAKMLLVGCSDESPGFTTVHYAQEVLGLTRKTFFSYLTHAFYISSGKLRRFVRKDLGGCSMGFGKFYPYYDMLEEGTVGNADCLLVNCKNAYITEKGILQGDPKFALCDDKGCLSCRCSWFYNLKDIPLFLMYKLVQLSKKII